MAMEKGITVWSAVDPLLEPPAVDLWPPPVHVVQNTESHVSQNSSSCTHTRLLVCDQNFRKKIRENLIGKNRRFLELDALSVELEHVTLYKRPKPI
jgi:hypothetical protein